MKVGFYQYILIGFLILFIISCVKDFDTKIENPNSTPNTTLANIPVDGDTLYALVNLIWDGEDNDGYVVAYEYSYITYPVGEFSGDSIVHDWVKTEETSLTIAFSSPNEINYQRFLIRSIDNSGNLDSTPAEKKFYTFRTAIPTTTILSPIVDAEFFAQEQGNIWWPGVQLSFTAKDEDGRIIEFAWSADGGEWHWIPAKEDYDKGQDVIIEPQYFAPPLDGRHTLRVFSKDDTYLIDSVGAQVNINLVVPAMDKDILILDDTREPNYLIRNVKDATVDSFYRDIFSYNNSYTIDERNMMTRGFPSLSILGQYKLVIWHSDDAQLPFYLQNTVTGNKTRDAISSYMNVGGDLILTGFRIVEAWYDECPDCRDGFGYTNHPHEFPEDTFVREYLHLVVGEQSSVVGTMSGAKGVGEFSDVHIDTAKVNPNDPHFGKLNVIECAVIKGGFTREILIFEGNDPWCTGLPCAWRYYGDVYDLAYISFPLFTLKIDEARTFAGELLNNMGY